MPQRCWTFRADISSNAKVNYSTGKLYFPSCSTIITDPRVCNNITSYKMGFNYSPSSEQLTSFGGNAGFNVVIWQVSPSYRLQSLQVGYDELEQKHMIQIACGIVCLEPSLGLQHQHCSDAHLPNRNIWCTYNKAGVAPSKPWGTR